MEGVIQGGFEFVIAAYTVTLVVLGGYWIHLVRRYRDEKRRGGGR